MPGTLGLAIYSVGYLSKLYYEAFEAVDQEVIEAVRATGISRLKEIRFVVVPESMNLSFSSTSDLQLPFC